jgi:hypothetical protein
VSPGQVQRAPLASYSAAFVRYSSRMDMRTLFTDASMMNAQCQSLTNCSDALPATCAIAVTSARRVLASAVPVTGRRVHLCSRAGACRLARHDHHHSHHLMPWNSFRGPGVHMLPHCPYWQVRRRKLEMQGIVGKHAPANANKLITIRAAVIDSLPVRTV